MKPALCAFQVLFAVELGALALFVAEAALRCVAYGMRLFYAPVRIVDIVLVAVAVALTALPLSRRSAVGVMCRVLLRLARLAMVTERWPRAHSYCSG